MLVRQLVKLCDHSGKLPTLVGLNQVRQRLSPAFAMNFSKRAPTDLLWSARPKE